MDVIKMEPDVDPLAIQTSGNAEADEKKPLPEDGNLLDLHVTGIKKERTDHWYELKSEMTYEETAEPRDFPIVKSEAEEGSCKLDPMEEVKLEVSAQDDEVLTEWFEARTACPGCDMKLMDFAVTLRNPVEWMGFLVSHGIFRQSVACPTCGDIRHLVIGRNDKCYYRCNNRHGKAQRCNFERSARQGTFVGGSKLSVEQILKFCALWCLLPNPRYRVLREETNITDKTATDWSSFCREVCLGWVYDNRRQIGGPGNLVEIHESKFGPPDYNRDKRIEGQWVFCGVERGSAGNFFLVPVQNRNAETLVEIISQWILPGTTIVSDCWRAYNALENEDFQQLLLDHSVAIVDTAGSEEIHIEDSFTCPAGQTLPIHTQDIEMKLRSIKNSMPVFGRKKEHLEGYFAEYIFKSNFPRSRLLCEFFKRAALMYPPPP